MTTLASSLISKHGFGWWVISLVACLILYPAEKLLGQERVEMASMDTTISVVDFYPLDFTGAFQKVDDYLYLVAGKYLRVFEVADLSNIRSIGRINIGKTGRSLLIRDQVAFVGQEGGLVTVDVSDPENMLQLHSQSVSNTILAVAVVDTLLYSVR